MIINELYKRLNKYGNLDKIDECININRELKFVNKSQYIQSGPFISNKIRDYINNELKYEYKIKFNYKNIDINISYCCKKNKETIKSIIIKIIRRIIFMMDISKIYKDVYITIYDTPFKKKLPCTSKHICNKDITVHNVNTGFNYLNNIVLYRREELLKVLVHEMIHLLNIDNKIEHMMENISIIDKFVGLFCIENTNILVNESYVETWAILLDVYIKLWEKKELNYKNYLKKIIKLRNYNCIQCAKILIYYNMMSFRELFKMNGICNKKITNSVNVFCYHILKLVNLYKLNKFVTNHLETNDKYVIKHGYNYNKYIEYLETNISIIEKDINKAIERIKKQKYNLSLKMSI